MKVFNGWDFVLLEFRFFIETLDGAFGKGLRGDVQYSVSLVPKWECDTLINQVNCIKRFGINSDVIVCKKC